MTHRVSHYLPATILILAGMIPGCGEDNQAQSKIVPVPASDNLTAQERRSGGGAPPGAKDTAAQRAGGRPSSYPAGKK